jgi:hypothetical protein
MNERIKLLAIQADWDDEFREDFDIKKFAELIVKECALVIQKKVGPKSALDVLEHFGVEE